MKPSRLAVLWQRSAGLCMLAFVLAAVPSGLAAAQDTVADRQAAATRYVQVFDLPKMLHDMIRPFALAFPPEKRREFTDFMNGLDARRLEKIAVDGMVRHFTAEELNALADFYSTSVGRSLIRKMPEFMANTMPAIQALVIERARQYPHAPRTRVH